MNGQHRRRLALLVAGVLLLLAGMAAGSALAATPPAATSVGARPPTKLAPVTSGEAEGSGPSRTVAGGLPAGWAHDEAGALAAGLAYATANQAWLYMTDEQIAASVRAIATRDAAAGLATDIAEAVGLARDALAASPGQVWWVARPLAARLTSYSEVRASVAVWVVSVLSAADVAVPQSAWVTTTVELRWVDGDWRLAASSDRPGPTPVLDNSDEPWPPETLEEALAGFELIGTGP